MNRRGSLSWRADDSEAAPRERETMRKEAELGIVTEQLHLLFQETIDASNRHLYLRNKYSLIRVCSFIRVVNLLCKFSCLSDSSQLPLSG